MSSLNKQQLMNDLRDMRRQMSEQKDSADELYVKTLADIIEKYVKSAKVIIIVKPSDIQVAGSATNQTNVNPLTLTGDPDSGGGLQ